MGEGPATAAGVEALIRRLRDEGVDAGEQARDRIIAEARVDAERLLGEARAHAGQLVAGAKAQAEAERTAAAEAVRLAYRDALLRLRQDVEALFERHVSAVLGQTLGAAPAMQTLIGDVVREAVACAAGRTAMIEVPTGTDSGDDALELWLRASTAEWLAQGIEVRPASGDGAGLRLRFSGDAHELDLSPGTLASLLLDRLRPRYRRLFGEPPE